MGGAAREPRWLLVLGAALALAGGAACGGASSAAPDAAGEDARGDVAAEPDVWEDPGPPSEAACRALFGAPNAKTGLTADQCQPRCDCEGRRFEPPAYTAEDVAALRSMTLLGATPPLTPLEGDPYQAQEAPVGRPDAVCAVRVEADGVGYRLQTFPSWGEAEAAGWRVTHAGACGLCSPLGDLAVYMERPDLTEPVRRCGLEHLLDQDPAEHLRCLMDLGFDEPCAWIWYYNTKHTSQACGGPCMALLDAPYHTPDGALNECLQCDEDESGPVFQAVAGRTRRNTGLPSSMCRPCSSVVPVVHRYR